ncbi:MAG TPA: S1/P1 Nuclease [Candidatus Dormibacteraeota bacterium]|nr:S1/P1 Nuclease [Candidatus Dormibacteraeota bacterium]
MIHRSIGARAQVIALTLALIAAVSLSPAAALAWGTAGHTLISRLAAEKLPASLPAFVRSPAAIAEIAALGPEEDNIKGAGESWDADHDAGHFLDVGDDGSVAGVVRLNALPDSMAAFADALANARTTPYRVGYVPYTIMDGFERVRKDFAYWRVDAYMAQHAHTASARQRFSAARALRETLTLRDLGDWGHFVADGSQPLHITIHYNGWGRYPNPHGYTRKHIHSYFESTFVDRYAKAGAVAARIPAYSAGAPGHLLSQGEIAAMVGNYLQGTASAVDPLYALYGSGDFQRGSARAVAFTDEQLARGATMYRNLIALAWQNSLYESVDYPPIPVRDILAGRVTPSRPI